MKANKVTTVKDLELNKPELTVVSLLYVLSTDKTLVEVHLKEEGAIQKHSRFIEFEGEVRSKQVEAKLKTIYSDFV